MLSVYINNQYRGKIPNNTKSIAKCVVSRPMDQNLTLVDGSNQMVLTSIGNMVHRVPNNKWLDEDLLPAIENIRLNNIDIVEVIPGVPR